ncbi:MAG: DUF721 domain-containing protein [Candidatus Tectomicrobia bacterium]|uniref:DUF721 domain-containing protein n=1 Tax=Tectimicrobiota bacterium TaxID=2528274 RepID=A0A932M0K7_UNCTE|nr:DUF721 domain-containing protein [Candidatus Tectomicrobia bacterium]
MSEKRGRFIRLGEILENSCSRLGFDQDLRQYKIQKIWPQAVGGPIAAISRVAGVKGQMLFIEVADPVWLQELHFLQDQILEKLRRFPEGEKISRLFFRIGKIEGQATAPAAGTRLAGAHRPTLPLTEGGIEEIEGLSGRISDPEAAGLIRGFLVRGYSMVRRGKP